MTLPPLFLGAMLLLASAMAQPFDFELVDPAASAWVKVRHKDGIIGFNKAIDIWGI